MDSVIVAVYASDNVLCMAMNCVVSAKLVGMWVWNNGFLSESLQPHRPIYSPTPMVIGASQHFEVGL